ncbi:acetyl-CoA acetyltransferase [Parafrankia colletiae]|uniref:Acetyl-CoA acetyltransferase n=1 Tax=Parafrankia colletiae TaxID=573497 RepID=A0A1S1Q7U2_9ACTN|nr:thiolase family protein [Parafrankia colletiae]MCK9903387.1 thiolase family protein [Frankia sp. Cpl3]OHV30010.1 acetyl-CoA acetyltransferase [Parafrankia colletiae]
MREAVIVEAVRTPIGKRNGSLAGVHPVDLAAMALNELISRTGIDPVLVDDVQWGCVGQVGDQSSNVGRYAVLAAGWPESVPAVTVNRACGSSQQALDQAVFAVMAGAQDLVVAGGVESMSRVPLGATRQSGEPYGPAAKARYDGFEFNQIVGAELIAERWGFTRRQLDEYASLSHERAAAAIDSGAFEQQTFAVPTESGPFTVDEGLRRGTTPEKLAGLKPVAKENGMIHAGNSSQISDGASAVLVTTPERARELGLRPIVRYHSAVVVGSDPVLMLTGPIPATQKVLARAGLSIGDIGAFEVNEAFSSVTLAWLAELGADIKVVNPLGGAIAVGHPLGASGTILMTRLAHHMRDNGIRYGLQTMCEGGGTANAAIVELVAE